MEAKFSESELFFFSKATLNFSSVRRLHSIRFSLSTLSSFSLLSHSFFSNCDGWRKRTEVGHLQGQERRESSERGQR